MMTFGQIVNSLGGWSWEPAVKGAQRLVAKCRLMGGNWIATDPFSELTMYRKLRYTSQEIFDRKWAMYRKEFTNTEKTAGDKDGDDGKIAGTDSTASSSAQGCAKETTKAKTKAKAKSRGKSSDPDGKGDAQNANSFAIVCKEATKVKTMYMAVMSSAASLATSIDTSAGLQNVRSLDCQSVFFHVLFKADWPNVKM